MIKDHIITKSIETHGDKANVVLGYVANGVNLSDADNASVLFDKFVDQLSSEIPITRKCVGNIPWTEEEKGVVSPCANPEKAWENYHARFPDSHRGKSAVMRWWTDYHVTPTHKPADGLPTGPDDLGACRDCNEHGKKFERCDNCAPPVKKGATPVPAEEKDPRKGMRYKRKNDLQIPFHSIDQKAQYAQAQKLCKKYGCTYPQALEKEAAAKKATQKDQPVVPPQPPREPPGEKKEHVTPPAQKKIRDLILAKNGDLKRGQFVQHNGPKSSPFFGKKGEILKVADDGQIFVKFGESSTWLVPHIVLAIPQAGEAQA